MYVGQTTKERKTYQSKYIPGIGDIPTAPRITLQLCNSYRCDALECGKVMAFLVDHNRPIVEPFYCSCGRLVSVLEGHSQNKE